MKSESHRGADTLKETSYRYNNTAKVLSFITNTEKSQTGQLQRSENLASYMFNRMNDTCI